MTYNKTQLSPDKEFDRHIYHRDQFAHYFRWTHVLKMARIGMRILDVGCGTGNLAEVFYRNRYRPTLYWGVDVRKQAIEVAQSKWKEQDWATFVCEDFVKDLDDTFVENTEKFPWDIVTCFEVLEHVGKNNVLDLLINLQKCMGPKTVLLLSTPVYDESVGAADNHMIDGEVGELTFTELHDFLDELFVVENYWGTFASQKDYKPWMNEHEQRLFERLHEYYDSNLLSNLMAPLFPELSRNILWRCTL